MKTPIFFSLCTLVLLVLLWPSRAAEPATTGHIVVLENGRVLEGDIERVGDQYRLRRTVGETWLPASQVQCLCGNCEEAYIFLRSQANLHDPDERLRLARWCMQHNLRSQALAEISAGLEIRPKHPESQRIWQNLQKPETACPASAKPHEEAEPDPTAPADFNSEALGEFVKRVQPVLMNTCAGCHANGRGGAFKLVRTYENALTNRRATQQNLAATLGQINRDRPQQSLLLTRALIAHGEAEEPPLKGRQAPAYRVLEEWAATALLNSSTREATPAAPSEPRMFVEPAAFKSPPTPAPAPGVPTTVAPVPLPPTSQSLPTAPSVPSPSTTPPPPAPAATPVTAPLAPAPPSAPTTNGEPADPFDPAIFNRQMHPEKTPGTR